MLRLLKELAREGKKSAIACTPEAVRALTEQLHPLLADDPAVAKDIAALFEQGQKNEATKCPPAVAFHTHLLRLRYDSRYAAAHAVRAEKRRRRMFGD